MTTEIKNTATNLQHDIDLICTAFDSCRAAIKRVQEHYPKDHLQISASTELAVWAHYRFAGDWSKFVEFTRQSLDAWSRDKSQMWVMGGPNRENPEADADRHLDRVDVALHLICKELGMKLPFETVREHGWHQREHLQRVQSFIKSINDVLQPRNA
jgi:hypothetical protein